MQVTICIPDDQASIYEQAKAQLGGSVSEAFVRCLARELENAKQRTGRIVVRISDGEGRIARKAFEGQFIVGSETEPEEFEFDPTPGIASPAPKHCGKYSVAVTKANRLVILEFDGDKIFGFNVHEDFDEFKDTSIDTKYPDYPETLIQAVADEMDIEFIEVLDI